MFSSQVPLAQRIARWTSNPKVLGSIPRWDDNILTFTIRLHTKRLHTEDLNRRYLATAGVLSILGNPATAAKTPATAVCFLGLHVRCKCNAAFRSERDD
jgi:hypothetical protein